MTDILPGDCVTIRTNKGDFSAGKVIITAGGWAPKLLKKLGVDLPLKVSLSWTIQWNPSNPTPWDVGMHPCIKTL